MSHKDGRVVLSAWVDPVLRDYVREAARLSGMEFSRWVERAVQQTVARESVDRAIVAASKRGLQPPPPAVLADAIQAPHPGTGRLIKEQPVRKKGGKR